MSEPIVKWSVGYVVLCEALAGTWLALYIASSPAVQWRSGGMALGAAICFAAACGLVLRKRWAWVVSIALGLAIFAGGLWLTWGVAGSVAAAQSEGGFALVTGLVFAVPSLCGVVLLCLPSTRRHLLRHRRRVRRRRTTDVYGQPQV